MSIQTGNLKLSVYEVFLIVAVGLFVLGALGLRFESLSLQDFGLACFAFAFLYQALRG